MRDEDALEVAADMQRLKNRVEEYGKQAKLLNNEGVDTKTSNTLLNGQEALQVQGEQLVSNLIQLLYESGSIEVEGEEVELPMQGALVIGHNVQTELPPPTVGKASREGTVPSWAKDPDTDSQ